MDKRVAVSNQINKAMKFGLIENYTSDVRSYIENYDSAQILSIEEKPPLRPKQFSKNFSPLNHEVMTDRSVFLNENIDDIPYADDFQEDSIIDVLDDFEAETVTEHKRELLKMCDSQIIQRNMRQYLNRMLKGVTDSDDESSDRTSSFSDSTGYYSEIIGVKKPLYCQKTYPLGVYKANYCPAVDDSSPEQPTKVNIMNLIQSFETGLVFQRESENVQKSQNKVSEIFKEVAKIKEKERRYSRCHEVVETEHNKENEMLSFDVIIPPPPEFQSAESSFYGTPLSDPSISSFSSITPTSTLSSSKGGESNISSTRFDLADDSEDSSFKGAGRGHEDMGSNLSKRRSQSSGNLSSGSKLQGEKYKLCGSLPNHLDLPADNNNEPKRAEDLGYGSEKSPEEDPPPPFPACPVHHAHFIKKYPFINSNSVFSVTVKKGSGGLGLSVCGGDPWPGLIRIKRLFPHQPASHSGLLSPGDILLAASGVPLLGLTNYEALEVLRSAPPEVKLTVCRPPETVVPPPVESNPPPPPPRDPLPPPTQYGEFEIVMEKMNGSLGFTLRKEDQSILGHYVRALVREPALSDTRIRPGDKIVAVNDVDMSSLSHEEAVAYLRQCGSLVRLRLYRDPAQTPLQPHSPTHSHKTFKPILRKEAQDMLSELAVKKSQSSQESSGSSKGSSPRKRRLTRTPPPTDSVDSLESMDDAKPRKSEQQGTERKSTYHFTANLATQSSEEELLLVRSGLGGSDPPPTEPVSMPPLGQQDSGFSYRNPAYRSANPPVSRPLVPQEISETGCSEQDIPAAVTDSGGTKGLLKWKGVVLFPETENTIIIPSDSQDQLDSVSSQKEPPTEPPPPPPEEPPEYQVVIVELNRGWNSRLGFSLQPSPEGGSVISAIYPDSVASRDGRLRIGDKIINVNDEGIENMDTPEVIDLLRKIRGSISLTLLRKTKQ